MNIAVSNLSYQGLFTNRLLKLPKEIGIEVYAETGSDFYWDHLLPKLMDGREGHLSVHGPYQNIDLSSPDIEFEAVRDVYEWTFKLCQKYNAIHCVCHPYAYRPRNTMTNDEIAERKRYCVERVALLHNIAQEHGVELLVENMAEKDGLLSQDTFSELFLPVEGLNFLIDLGHANIQEWDMDSMFECLGGRIRGYHINDNFGDADSHLMAFAGNYDWNRFFCKYQTYTPNASLVCEYINGTIDEIVASVQAIAKCLKQSH
jgi:sugar phosphate isomerase/epimerase